MVPQQHVSHERLGMRTATCSHTPCKLAERSVHEVKFRRCILTSGDLPDDFALMAMPRSKLKDDAQFTPQKLACMGEQTVL